VVPAHPAVRPVLAGLSARLGPLVPEVRAAQWDLSHRWLPSHQLDRLDLLYRLDLLDLLDRLVLLDRSARQSLVTAP
jgi:hypothetical protein